nr:uncharacterized protein LOC125979872 isoform X13 [Syngnathus scovelli]
MPRKSKKAQALKVSWQKRKNNTDSGSAGKPTAAKELMAIEPENSMEVMMSTSHDPVTCVLASYSQDHPKYTDSRNSQCAANSVTFLAFLQETDNVTSAHLDLVLDRGNELYVATVAMLKAEGRYEHHHLATDEIPSIVRGFHKQHVLIKYQSMYGLFNSSIADVAFMMLRDGLQCLVSEVNCALLVMNSLFIAVFQNQGRYGYFDPHARERDGLPLPAGAPHGTAVMMLFTRLNDLIDKLIQVFTLAGAAPTTQYELMPVSFQPIDNPSDREMATDGESSLMRTHNDDAMLSQSAAEMTQRVVTGESRPCASKHYESIEEAHDNSKVECTQQKQTRDVLKIAKSKRKTFERRTQAHKIIDKAMARVTKQETRRINTNLKKKESYSQTPEIRQRKKSYIVTRYQQDPNFRVKQKSFAVDRYCKHDTIKMKQRSYSKQKYSHDDEYRAKKCYSIKQKYSYNVEYRTRKCSYINQRYGHDDQFRNKQRSYIKQRYGHDDQFRNKQRSYIKQRYSHDDQFRNKQRSYIKQKYGHDDQFRNKQRSYIKQRYSHDDTFRNKQRSYIKQRYGHDDEFRRKQRSYIKERYALDPVFRSKQKENTSLVWKAKHDSSMKANANRTALKLLQKYRVINRLCKERNDCAIMKAVALFQVQVPDERKMEWICHTCHAHLKDGKMPALALPPVRQSKPLCVYDPTRLDHWRDNFKKITLTTVMRQKDDVAFAELLNRLRVKEKSDELSELDRALLATRYTSPEMCPSHILHVFATNKQVDGHNSAMLTLLHKDIVQIDADDYKKDKRTGRMARQTFPVQGAKSELPDSIKVALGARVMLTRNIDVQAGLCNGTFAKIVELVNYPNEARVQKLGLELDHVSNTARAANRVYIDRQEEKLKKAGVMRRQFPIKLAFACTIHKVQGMTTSEAAVSLKGVFEHGMGYVALSRVTSLSGLHILHMDERRLHANPEITAALAEMAEDSLESVMPLLNVMPSVDRANHLVVIHHNTEGLSCHVQDIRCHHELHFADVLCFTETHFQGSVADGRACLEGFTMFHRNRRDSYTNCPDLATKLGGGVGICVKSHIAAQEKKYIQGVTDIEFVVVKLEAPLNVLIAAVYRPPGNSLRTFLPSLGNLLRYLEVMDHHQILVCGDFNEDMLSASFKPILDLFRSTGYTQLITTATTDKNTLLDLIFVSRPQCALHSGVLQTYYSYHNPVFCVLTTER